MSEGVCGHKTNIQRTGELSGKKLLSQLTKKFALGKTTPEGTKEAPGTGEATKKKSLPCETCQQKNADKEGQGGVAIRGHGSRRGLRKKQAAADGG